MPKVTLTDLSSAALRKELARRERAARRLLKRRKALLKQLAAIDAEIGGAAPKAAPAKRGKRGPGRPKKAKSAARKARPTQRRAKNKANLPSAMAAVMSKDKAMGTREIITAVKAAGYQSTSKNFETIVYQALRDKRFKKVARGKYTLAG